MEEILHAAADFVHAAYGGGYKLKPECFRDFMCETRTSKCNPLSNHLSLRTDTPHVIFPMSSAIAIHSFSLEHV